MFNSSESAEKSAFLFEQVREIYALLQPISIPNAARRTQYVVRWMVVLEVALVATLLAVLIAARNPFPTWPLIGLEVLTLVLLALYGYLYTRQDLRDGPDCPATEYLLGCLLEYRLMDTGGAADSGCLHSGWVHWRGFEDQRQTRALLARLVALKAD